jgi:hypothetical protein
MQGARAVRNMMALAVSFVLLSNGVFAQQTDASAKVYARLSKLPRNAEIEVRLQNRSRVSGHLVRFDQRELVLAEQS